MNSFISFVPLKAQCYQSSVHWKPLADSTNGRPSLDFQEGFCSQYLSGTLAGAHRGIGLSEELYVQSEQPYNSVNTSTSTSEQPSCNLTVLIQVQVQAAAENPPTL